MSSLKVQLLLCSIFSVAVYSDKSIQFGFVVGNKSPFCETEKVMEPVGEEAPSFDHFCKVRHDVYVAAVKVISRGHPAALGGAQLVGGGIRSDNVTVRVWGEAHKKLDAGVYVYVNWTDPTTTIFDQYYGPHNKI